MMVQYLAEQRNSKHSELVGDPSSSQHDAAKGMGVYPALFMVAMALVVNGGRSGDYRHSTRQSLRETMFRSNYILVM